MSDIETLERPAPSTKGEKLWREGTLTTRANGDDSLVNLSFSSEEPYARHYGDEILDHSPGSVRLDWLQSGRAPVLLGHDSDVMKTVGVVVSATLGSDRVGRATIRLGKDELAEGVLRKIRDGVLVNVSVGYRIHKMVHEETGNDGESYRATDWEPLEISLVSIPADMTVGVGRSGDNRSNTMSTNENLPAEAKRYPGEESGKNKILNILAMADHQKSLVPGVEDMARRAIEEDWTVPQFRNWMLDNIPPVNALVRPDSLDLSPKENRAFSLSRALQAATTGDWSKAGAELEASDEISRRLGREARGFFIPTDVLMRDLTVGTASAGGNVAGTTHQASEYVDALRAQLVTGGLGAKVIHATNRGDLSIPGANATANVEFVAENGEPTEGAPTFRQITMSPKTVAGYVDMSRKLIIQSDPAIDQLIRADMFAGIAAKIDEVAIEGAGSNEPTGITQTAGIGSVAMGTDGAAITYGATVDLIGQVSQDNALQGNLAYITTPQVITKMRQTAKVSSTDSVMIMDDPDRLNGYRVLPSSLVPSDLAKGTGTNLNAMVFGNWRELILAFWSGIDVTVDTATFSKSGGVRLAFFQDVDVAVRHAESFAAILDIDVS
jgi:HK97 family phage major capsid protein/HK97 family phage prohead protease